MESVEPVAEGDAAQAATEAAAPVEVELIEVWRPHRQNQHGRRPERGAQQRRPQRAAPAPAQQPGQAEPAVPVEGGAPPRRDDRRRGGGEHVRRESGGEGKPAGRPDRGPRPPGGGDRAKGGDRRPERDRDQRRSGGGGGDRTFATTERPAPRERQPDPNSPFAKLLALKAELEGKGKKD